MIANKVTFKGKEYLCSDKEGPIFTADQYRDGKVSFAYLKGNGDIVRFREKIGSIDDLVFGEEVESPEMTDEGFMRVLEQLKWL